MRFCSLAGGVSRKEYGIEIYAGKRNQQFNKDGKKKKKKLSTYQLARLVESA